jgi:hypothetical protein
MGLTEAQLAERYKHLGASDVAAIMGVSSWANAYDMWLQKTQRVPPTDETEVMYAGTKFEAGVLEFAAEQLGPLETDEDLLEFEWQGFPVKVHCDALVLETGKPVEAKTCGLFGPLRTTS